MFGLPAVDESAKRAALAAGESAAKYGGGGGGGSAQSGSKGFGLATYFFGVPEAWLPMLGHCSICVVDYALMQWSPTRYLEELACSPAVAGASADPGACACLPARRRRSGTTEWLAWVLAMELVCWW